LNNHLRVDLNPREDKNQQIFYLGKLQYPGFIDCSEGVTFLIFLSQDGEEELQIAPSSQDNNVYNTYVKKPDRINVLLESRLDQYNKVFYICKLQFKGLIDCRHPVSFIVFNAKLGAEELQIVGPIIKNPLQPPKPSRRSKGPEIIIKSRRLSVDA
jgi:hypothetical protein